MLNDVQYQPEGTFYLGRFLAGLPTPSLILIGDEGVGRKFSVVETIKELYCQGDKSPTCPCSECYQVTKGIHPDLKHICSVDGKDIGIDVIREAVSEAYISPTSGPFRVYIVDGADKLTVPASSALLKTLEETPETTKFFLLAESYDQVIPTIRSRCGRVQYRRLPEEFVISVMGKFEKDPVKSLVYSRIAEGSIGRAVKFWGSNRLKLRDQVYALFQYGAHKDLSSLFSAFDEIGGDLGLSLRFMDQVLHDLMVVGVDSSRVINQDILEVIGSLASKTNLWGTLREQLKTVQDRYMVCPIHLSFHLKSAYVNTFFS